MLRVLYYSVLLCSITAVTVKNNGYDNIVVSLSPGIPEDGAKALIESIQQTLQETSSVLHKAIGLRISSATFLLPASWDMSGWQDVSINQVQSGTLRPDFKIQAPSFNGSTRPRAIQFAGCGVSGMEVTVPVEFFITESVFPKSKLLARECLKYRYGVYDENGFQHDSLYPDFYYILGIKNALITGCTDPDIGYIYRDSTGNNCTIGTENCEIHPDEENAVNVKSSLMYYHEDLRNMDSICGKDNHTHNSVAPNKHNVLCNGRSVWDVIQSSTDFLHIKSTSDVNVGNVKFSYVQERQPRVIGIWQDTVHLKEKGELILLALKRFMYDLPSGSKYGFIDFNSEPHIISELTEVSTDTNFEPVRGSFLYPEPPSCVTCSLATAVELLMSDTTQQAKKGSIVLLAASNPTASEDTSLVKTLLKDWEICLTVVLFMEATEEGFQDLAEASPCGFVEKVSASDDRELFSRTYTAMRNMLVLPETNVEITTVGTNYLRYGTPLVIPSDVTAAKFTLWLMQKWIDKRYVNCSTIDSKADVPLVNEKPNANIAVYSFESPNEDVKCEFSYNTIDPVLTQVQMTSKPGQHFEEKVWVFDSTPSSSKEQMPIIIYASIHFDHKPVQKALVKVEVANPDGSLIEMSLVDDGLGDPDITKNDGIYSGYFKDFTKEGTYAIKVTAENFKAWTQVGQQRIEPCCGSNFESDTEWLQMNFRRNFATYFHAISGKPEKGYPPSRILDLRIANMAGNEIKLQWNAPGGELHSGRAKTYTIKSFTSVSEAYKHFDDSEDSTLFTNDLEPQEYGNAETFSFDTNSLGTNATHFVFVRATNDKDLQGTISNFVVFYVSSTDKKPEEQRKRGGADGKTIGIIVGVVVATLAVVICIYVAFFCFVIKPERKRAKAAKNGQSETGRRVAIEVNSLPADVILKHHNEVIIAKSQNKQPPIFTEENVEAVESRRNMTKDDEFPARVNDGYTDTETGDDASPSIRRMTAV